MPFKCPKSNTYTCYFRHRNAFILRSLTLSADSCMRKKNSQNRLFKTRSLDALFTNAGAAGVVSTPATPCHIDGDRRVHIHPFFRSVFRHRFSAIYISVSNALTSHSIDSMAWSKLQCDTHLSSLVKVSFKFKLFFSALIRYGISNCFLVLNYYICLEKFLTIHNTPLQLLEIISGVIHGICMHWRKSKKI